MLRDLLTRNAAWMREGGDAGGPGARAAWMRMGHQPRGLAAAQQRHGCAALRDTRATTYSVRESAPDGLWRRDCAGASGPGQPQRLACARKMDSQSELEPEMTFASSLSGEDGRESDLCEVRSRGCGGGIGNGRRRATT